MSSTNYLENQAANRKQALDSILGSDSRRKLIIAGPGTGKTFTFAKLFQKYGSDTIQWGQEKTGA